MNKKLQKAVVIILTVIMIASMLAGVLIYFL